MNYRAVLRYVGLVLAIEGLFMLPALLVCFIYGEMEAAKAMGVSFLLTTGIGGMMSQIRVKDGIYAREGFVIVALAWLGMSFFGALPFWISREIPSFVDAFFETVSGFTTTGSSILTNVEALGYGMLYWRSFSHWLGGMGVLVFLLAIVPLARGSGETLHLLRAESPGPAPGKMTPTIRNTSRALYGIYVAMTAVEIVLLLIGGMPLFDAVVHAFGTAGTGGFSIKGASIAAYDSAYLQLVIAIFMALFGINFNMYYLLLLRNGRSVWKNEELRVYLSIMAAATVIIAFNILPGYTSVGRAFLDSFFQVSSIMTTTGYATADFNLWPQLSRLLLVLLMFVGASAGSTGGGIKVSRLLILWKHMMQEMRTMLRPRSVQISRMDGKRLEDSTVRGASTFLVAYCIICCLSMALVSLDNFSLVTTVTAVIACINNIGPGLDMVGATGNYSQFSPFVKLVLSLDMLLGRLEIFPMLLLFLPSVWKKRV